MAVIYYVRMRRIAIAFAFQCAYALHAGPDVAFAAPVPLPAPDAAAARYRRGLALKASRRYVEAAEEFRAAALFSPRDLRAHREYQNLMLDLGRQEELVREYGEARRRAPLDAAAAYLWGRLLDDPSHQGREFRRSIALDPCSPWGHYGLAMVRLRRGDPAGAGEEIDAALALSPSSMQAAAARAMLDSIAGRREEALDRYRALCTDADAPEEVFAAALGECRILGRDADGAAISAEAVERFPESPLLGAWRGWFLARAGGGAGAVAWYEKAARQWPLPFLFAADLRRLCAESGMHARAVSLWRSLFGTQLSSAGNRLLPSWRLAEERALVVSDGAGSGALIPLAEAYEGMGWWAEAAAAREAAGEEEAGGGALADDLDGARLLDALEGYGRWLDGRVRLSARRVSFAAAVRELGRVSGEADGRALLQLRAVRSMAGARWLDGGAGRPQPLIERIRGGNREIIFFENTARGRISYEVAEVIRCAAGAGGAGGAPHREIVCCPSGSGVLEGESGLAYPPFDAMAVFYDPSRWSALCAARRAPWRDPLGHPWFLEETGGRPLGPREVAYSRMLEKRLFEKACRSIRRETGAALEPALEDRYAEIVAAHERQHLRDLRGFLPVGRHPGRCLRLAAAAFFSPRRIERWFEERAIAASLVRGGDPDIWLLALQMQIAGERGAHADAVRRILSRIVRRVASDPRAFPAIDCRRNIMNQLYLLEGGRLRAVVRELYGGVG